MQFLTALLFSIGIATVSATAIPAKKPMHCFIEGPCLRDEYCCSNKCINELCVPYKRDGAVPV